MRRTFLAVVLLLGCPALSAQLRVEAGLATGTQSYESTNVNPPFLISPELSVSRRRLSLYYALDHADLSSAGTLYASHFGLGYRWPLPRDFSVLAGAGPSYVTVEHLGGEPTFHAQLELARRTGGLEWFAKLRHCEFGLSEFRIADASPDGPALLGGVRFTLNR